jgi:Flp pilus assembly protein TadD
MNVAAKTALWLLVAGAALIAGCSQTRQMVQQHNPITQGARDRSVRYDLAQVAEREGNLRKAADEYRTLLEKKPHDAQLCHRLGVVQIRLGEHEEGLKRLQQANELHKNDRTILNDLGYAYLETDDFDAAEKQFRAALAINPNDPRTINNLGLCAGFAGRTDEAYSLFRRVGGEAEAQANLAYVLAQRGDIELAMQHYNRALTVDPNLRPAAEALIQLTSLSQDIPRSQERIAEKPAAAGQPVIRQASATAEHAPHTPAPQPPAPHFEPPQQTAPSALGFSAPAETQFYRPVINGAGK